MLGSWNSHRSVEGVQDLAFMNTTDIYRQAIKRTFADLYSVARHEVDVSWNKDGDNIAVRCANKTFTHDTIPFRMHGGDHPRRTAAVAALAIGFSPSVWL